MKRLLILLAWLAGSSAAIAQGLPRVYNEDINPMTQIDSALVKAKGEAKYVVCQVGGNWCPWCLRFADFITKDSTISQVIADNFVYIHVNYNPRRPSESAAMVQLTADMMQRLGNPARFGFPVFVVLDAAGKVLHTQDSSFLEEGDGYNKDKVLRFFKAWTPDAVAGKQ